MPREEWLEGMVDPSTVNKGSLFFTYSPALILSFLDGSSSDWGDGDLRVVLVCNSLVPRIVEHFF